jgi:hypothetical protein
MLEHHQFRRAGDGREGSESARERKRKDRFAPGCARRAVFNRP